MSLMISTSAVVREWDSTHRHACGSRDKLLEFIVVLPRVEVVKIDSARVGVPWITAPRCPHCRMGPDL